jgi:hypothetical protein
MDWYGKLKRAFFAGAVGGILTQVVYGSVGSVYVLGMQMGSSVAAGVSCALGDIGGQAAQMFIPSTGYLGELGAAGLVTAASLDYMGLDSGITPQGFALGAVSSIGGKYAEQMVGGGAMPQSNAFY